MHENEERQNGQDSSMSMQRILISQNQFQDSIIYDEKDKSGHKRMISTQINTRGSKYIPSTSAQMSKSGGFQNPKKNQMLKRPKQEQPE
jgi:hypothetical protein